MTLQLAVVMDPIGTIDFRKDTTLSILLAAQARGMELYHVLQSDLYLDRGRTGARMQPLTVADDPRGWYRLGEPVDRPLAEMDVVLMRKDPPFDTDYLHATYLLELATAEGTLVVNDPRALRDCNEKLAVAWFPELAPPTLVAAGAARILAFLEAHGDIILKPLDSMGGASVFRLRLDDPNRNVIIETLTRHGRRQVMAQRFIPEVAETGDKRILVVDGEPLPRALARIPAPGETRANLATGGRGVGVELTPRDREICARVGPELARRGILFAGLDVIGGWLTEVNVTSPTGARQLEAEFGLDVGGRLLDAVAARLGAGTARRAP